MRQSISTPGGNGRSPIPAFDLADVQIDRMILVLEVSTTLFLLVPFRFEIAQLADDAVRGVDCVGASPHLAHVHGQTADLDLKPDHADIGADQLLVLRFGNQNGIRLVSAEMRHEGAVNCGGGPRTLLGFTTPEQLKFALSLELMKRTPASQTNATLLAREASAIRKRGWELAIDDFVSVSRHWGRQSSTVGEGLSEASVSPR